MAKGRKHDSDAATLADVARVAALPDPLAKRTAADYLGRLAAGEASLARKSGDTEKAQEYAEVRARANDIKTAATAALAAEAAQLVGKLTSPLRTLPPDLSEDELLAALADLDLERALAVLTELHLQRHPALPHGKEQPGVFGAARDRAASELAAEHRELLNSRLTQIRDMPTGRDQATAIVELAREVEERLARLRFYREFAAAAMYVYDPPSRTWNRSGAIAGFSNMEVHTLRRRYVDEPAPAIPSPESLARVVRVEYEALDAALPIITATRDAIITARARAEVPPFGAKLDAIEKKDSTGRGDIVAAAAATIAQQANQRLGKASIERRNAGFALHKSGWTWQDISKAMDVHVSRLNAVRGHMAPENVADWSAGHAEMLARLNAAKVALLDPLHKRAVQVRDWAVCDMDDGGMRNRDIMDVTGMSSDEVSHALRKRPQRDRAREKAALELEERLAPLAAEVATTEVGG